MWNSGVTILALSLLLYPRPLLVGDISDNALIMSIQEERSSSILLQKDHTELTYHSCSEQGPDRAVSPPYNGGLTIYTSGIARSDYSTHAPKNLPQRPLAQLVLYRKDHFKYSDTSAARVSHKKQQLVSNGIFFPIILGNVKLSELNQSTRLRYFPTPMYPDQALEINAYRGCTVETKIDQGGDGIIDRIEYHTVSKDGNDEDYYIDSDADGKCDAHYRSRYMNGNKLMTQESDKGCNGSIDSESHIIYDWLWRVTETTNDVDGNGVIDWTTSLLYNDEDASASMHRSDTTEFEMYYYNDKDIIERAITFYPEMGATDNVTCEFHWLEGKLKERKCKSIVHDITVSSYSIVYHYNDLMQLMRQEVIRNEQKGGFVRYQYNDAGTLVLMENFRGNSVEPHSVMRYYYDNQNRKIRTETRDIVFGDTRVDYDYKCN